MASTVARIFASVALVSRLLSCDRLQIDAGILPANPGLPLCLCGGNSIHLLHKFLIRVSFSLQKRSKICKDVIVS